MRKELVLLGTSSFSNLTSSDVSQTWSSALPPLSSWSYSFSFVISWLSWSSYSSPALLLYMISPCSTETSEEKRLPWFACKMYVCPGLENSCIALKNHLYAENWCGMDASGKSVFVKCRNNRKKKGFTIKIIVNLKKCFTNTEVE